MKAHKEELSIDALPQSLEPSFISLVTSFSVDEGSAVITTLQQDGATAVIDLSVEFEKFATDSQVAHCARVIGRLSDIQVRDFALGSHNRESFSDDHGNWRYDTVIARATEDLIAHEVNDESHEVRWVEIEKVDHLNLHPSFAKSWPQLKALIQSLE